MSGDHRLSLEWASLMFVLVIFWTSRIDVETMKNSLCPTIG